MPCGLCSKKARLSAGERGADADPHGNDGSDEYQLVQPSGEDDSGRIDNEGDYDVVGGSPSNGTQMRDERNTIISQDLYDDVGDRESRGPEDKVDRHPHERAPDPDSLSDDEDEMVMVDNDAYEPFVIGTTRPKTWNVDNDLYDHQVGDTSTDEKMIEEKQEEDMNTACNPDARNHSTRKKNLTLPAHVTGLQSYGAHALSAATRGRELLERRKARSKPKKAVSFEENSPLIDLSDKAGRQSRWSIGSGKESAESIFPSNPIQDTADEVFQPEEAIQEHPSSDNPDPEGLPGNLRFSKDLGNGISPTTSRQRYENVVMFNALITGDIVTLGSKNLKPTPASSRDERSVSRDHGKDFGSNKVQMGTVNDTQQITANPENREGSMAENDQRVPSTSCDYDEVSLNSVEDRSTSANNDGAGNSVDQADVESENGENGHNEVEHLKDEGSDDSTVYDRRHVTVHATKQTGMNDGGSDTFTEVRTEHNGKKPNIVDNRQRTEKSNGEKVVTGKDGIMELGSFSIFTAASFMKIEEAVVVTEQANNCEVKYQPKLLRHREVRRFSL